MGTTCSKVTSSDDAFTSNANHGHLKNNNKSQSQPNGATRRPPRGRMIIDVDGSTHKTSHLQTKQQQQHPPIVTFRHRNSNKNNNVGSGGLYYNPSTSLFGGNNSSNAKHNSNNSSQMQHLYHPDPEIISFYHRSIQIVQQYQTYQILLLLQQHQQQQLEQQQQIQCSENEKLKNGSQTSNRNAGIVSIPLLSLQLQQPITGQHHLLYKRQQHAPVLSPLSTQQYPMYDSKTMSPSVLYNSQATAKTSSKKITKNSNTVRTLPTSSPTMLANITDKQILKSSNLLCLENIVTTALVGNSGGSKNRSNSIGNSSNVLSAGARSFTQLQEQRPTKKALQNASSTLDQNSSTSKAKRRSSSVPSSKKKKSSASTKMSNSKKVNKNHTKKGKGKNKRPSTIRHQNRNKSMYEVQFRTQLYVRQPMLYPDANNIVTTPTTTNNNFHHPTNPSRPTSNRRFTMNLLPLRSNTNNNNNNNNHFSSSSGHNNSNYYHMQEEGISNTHIYAIRWPIRTKIKEADDDNDSERAYLEQPAESHPTMLATPSFTSVEVEDISELTAARATRIYDVDSTNIVKDDSAQFDGSKNDPNSDADEFDDDDYDEHSSDDNNSYYSGSDNDSENSSSSIYDYETDNDDEENDAFAQLQNDPQMMRLLKQNLQVSSAVQRTTSKVVSDNSHQKKVDVAVSCKTGANSTSNSNHRYATGTITNPSSSSQVIAFVDDATTVPPATKLSSPTSAPTATTSSKSVITSASPAIPKVVATTTTTTTTATVTSTSSTDHLFHPSTMAQPPKRKVVDWVTVSSEHKIYVADVGLSMEECNHMVAITEQQCRGQYAAYTYAKQTLGCREFPILAHAVHDAVHTVVSAIIEHCNDNNNCSIPDNVATRDIKQTNSDTTPRTAQSHRPFLALDDREPHMVKYDVTKKERQKLDMHTDKSEWTFLIAISNGAGMDYVGGGTYFECLDATVHVQRGHALIFPGKLRHCGQRISTGLRFLLVGFLVDKTPVATWATATTDAARDTDNSAAQTVQATSSTASSYILQSTSSPRMKTNSLPAASSPSSTSRPINVTEYDDDNTENVVAADHLHYHHYFSS